MQKKWGRPKGIPGKPRGPMAQETKKKISQGVKVAYQKVKEMMRNELEKVDGHES